MNKPQQIIELENKLGFTLTEVKRVNHILICKRSKSRTYAISETQEIYSIEIGFRKLDVKIRG